MKAFPHECRCFYCHVLYMRPTFRAIYCSARCQLAREAEIERVHAENAGRLNASGKNVYERKGKAE